MLAPSLRSIVPAFLLAAAVALMTPSSSVVALRCGTHQTTQSVKYLAPGQGSCDYYTDDTHGACMNPQCIKNDNLCGKTIWVTSADGSTTINDVKIVDSCPGISDCDSIWVTKSVFLALGGSIDAGNINDVITWGFNDCPSSQTA